jgi:hypothetical protein
MAYVYQEYPKWITGPNDERLIVDNAEAEAAQNAAWGPAPAPKRELPQLDHDQNGKPGGSLKPEGDDLASLRVTYKAKFGKKPFAGWDADALREKIGAAE